MKKALKIIVPILLSLVVLASIGWYLFVYDSAFTQELLLNQARRFEDKGKHSAAVWMYNLAYGHSGEDESIAIELAEQYRSIGNYTKAEYTLSNAIADGPSAELYIALSKLYVEQDKLLDAVEMLDRIDDASILAQLEPLRPDAPVITPESGFYNQYIQLQIQSGSGTLYVTSDGTYPSIEQEPYGGELTLPAGETTVYALSVAENGLVSPVTICGYTVVGVIEPVTFQDAAVEAAAREVLGFRDETIIYTNDLWSITDFTIPVDAQNYQDLTYMINLKRLEIPYAKSGDFAFLSALENLESLKVSGIALSADALKQIGATISLQELYLPECSISTIAPLSGLHELRTINLNNNSIRDLKPLSGLLNLEKIFLKYNAVNSVSDLTSLTNLNTLDLSYNSLTSIATIGACVNLMDLDVSHNQLTDLKAVSNLKNLQIFAAADNQLNDIAPLAACLELTDLDISGNTVADISTLGTLKKLMYLDFSNNAVTTLPVWPKDCALVSLDGSYNDISSVEELADLYNLNSVNLDYNTQLESIDALENCPALIQVDVYGTLVTDVTALTDHSIVVNFDPTSISVTEPEETTEE